MTEIQEKAIRAVSALQPTEKTAVWMVGEQLKDIFPERTRSSLCAGIAGRNLKCHKI